MTTASDGTLEARYGKREAARRLRAQASGCRQTSCKHCEQDIENLWPYRKGEWRDRGNNPTCPTPEGDAGQVHEPIKGGN